MHAIEYVHHVQEQYKIIDTAYIKKKQDMQVILVLNTENNLYSCYLVTSWEAYNLSLNQIIEYFPVLPLSFAQTIFYPKKLDEDNYVLNN